MTDRPYLFRDGPGPVLLMLHGTGGDEEQISTLAAHLDETAAILAPRGRRREAGMNRWFRRYAEGAFDTADVIGEAYALTDFLTSVTAELHLGGRPLVAVGFSNGANMALATAMLRPESVSRVLAFSGMHPLPDRPVEADLRGSSVLLVNGRDDPMAPAVSVDRLASDLEHAGATVDRVQRPGGHGLADTDLRAARRWLADVAARADGSP